MTIKKQLLSTTLALGLSLFAGGAAATSPCPLPTLPPLVSLDRPDWVIAQVSVVEQLLSGLLTPPNTTRVSVDRVFAGTLESQIIEIEGDYTFFDCGVGIPARNIGASFLVGIAGPNSDGSYGGRFALNRLFIQEGRIVGEIPDFQASDESKTLEEFAAYINTLTPRAETDDYLLTIEPRLPGPTDEVSLHIESRGGLGCVTTLNAVAVDRANAAIEVSFNSFSPDISPCIPMPRYSVSLPPLDKPFTQNSYVVSVFQESVRGGASPFQDDQMIAEFEYAMREAPSLLFNPEVPQEGSVQSGVGLIRGWACEAEHIEVQLNDRPRMPLAHGSSRPDTREVCGDSNNGYGAAYAWGLLGPGQHSMHTFIDGQLVQTVSFEVSGLEDEFAIGLDATYELEDFPAPGQKVTVQWSEAAQNFIIVESEQ